LLMEMKVHQVMGLGEGMVRMVLVRRGLKARIEPIGKTEEQRMAEEIATRIQQAFEGAFPGGLIVGGPVPPGRQWDAKVDMVITEEEYERLGKPSINDTITIEMSKSPE
jgi:hypothetical protein